MKAASSMIDPLTLIEGLGSTERKAIFKLQTEILQRMTNKLVEKKFHWILPIMISKSTDPLWPDPGAGIEKRIELEIYGERVKTMQSMIIHKRVLVSLGPERFFILSPNIRIETRKRANTGLHLYEFTQLEVEMAYAKMEEVFRLFEDLIQTSISSIKEQFHKELKILGRDITVPETPFKIYTKKALEDKFGEKWEEIVSQKFDNPLWVTDIPREFYDYEDERTGAWQNFDLILPEGYGEVISGAEREHEYPKILKKIKRDGLKEEDYQLLLRLAEEEKLKPSAGAGLGIERFIAYVCGVQHVAEVQPFPRIPGIVPDL